MSKDELKEIKYFFLMKKMKRYKLLIKYNFIEINNSINKKVWFDNFINKYKLKNTNLISFYNAYNRYNNKNEIIENNINTDSDKSSGIDISNINKPMNDNNTFIRRTERQNNFE